MNPKLKEKFTAQIEAMKPEEVFLHARVSIDNSHYCKECFCCMCLDYLMRNPEEIQKAVSRSQSDWC